jgi:uncharacterized Zn finger protein
MVVRGFPAFPPSARRGGRFARSWWGRAWVTAVEDTLLARELLTKGRRYASAGQVGSITVSPGRIAAPVHDGDPDTPHRTRVFVERLTDAEWDRFLDQAASRAGHVAALLDRELPRELVEAAADAGVRLLPVIGDLVPDCTCPDGGFACVHAAAVCYQTSWLLDADPLLLLLLRGRDEQELLGDLPQRTVHTGTLAKQAYAQPVAALPAPPPIPPAAESADPLLAAAARRARQLLLLDPAGQEETES